MAKEKVSRKGCHISCCMACTIIFAFVVLLALIVIAILFTVPSGIRSVTRTCPSCYMSDEQTLSRCESIVNRRNICIGMCEMDVIPGSGGSVIDNIVDRDRETPSEPPGPEPLTDIRLNRTVIPSHYNIVLQPWIYEVPDARLNGSVEIFITCERSTKVIVLHALGITVDQGSIELRERNPQGRKLNVNDFEVDEPRHFIKIYTLDALVPTQQYVLKMNFTGSLLQDLKGFYRSVYSYYGVPRMIASTQFQEADARRAFPCFDEPSFKATFTISLVRKAGYVALSNMPRNRTETRGLWEVDTFEKTPIMSTYIVAMFVGQYNFKERITSRGTKLRVWTQPNYLPYVDYALDVTSTILQAFEDYTDIRYPLPKLDQVALRNFRAGAMENWGLIMYVYGTLLIHPDRATTEEKRIVVNTIAHELSHQWFGNLVTMDWWDDTFLNEALATYMSNYVGVPSVKPSWNMEVYFVKSMQEIMKQDTSWTTQPIRLEGLELYSELHDAFSLITYRKGASVMRMVRYFLTEDTFRNALQHYLQEFSYKTATKADLVRAFAKQARAEGRITWDESRTNLTQILDSWLEQLNYPLVEVTDLKDGRVRAKQSRFVDNPNGPNKYLPVNGRFSWYIPLTYADKTLLQSQQYRMHWIYGEDIVNFQDRNAPGWKLVNVFSQGFYRVKYDPDTWISILRQLETDHNLIPVESRAELLSDAFALADEGYVDDLTAIRATRYLRNETEYVPWVAATTGRFNEYKKILRKTPSYGLLNAYTLTLVQPNYMRLGWAKSQEDAAMQNDLRALILKAACDARYQPCVSEALREFLQYKNNVTTSLARGLQPKNTIEPDLKAVVYCTAVRHGGLDVLQFLLAELFAASNNSDYLGNDLNALVLGSLCVEEPASVTMFLDFVTSGDLSALLDLFADQPSTVDLLWDYLDRNWLKIPARFDKIKLLWKLTDFFGTMADYNKLMHFIDDHPSIHQQDAIELGMKVRDNIAWINQNEPAIRDWLQTERFLNGGLRRRRRSAAVSGMHRPGEGFRHARMGNSRFAHKVHSGDHFSLEFNSGKLELHVLNDVFK